MSQGENLILYIDILFIKSLEFIPSYQELWLSGVGTKQYPIHALAMHHGPARCKVLPALYYLTGSEVTSKVNTKLAALRAKPEDYLMDFARGERWNL